MSSLRPPNPRLLVHFFGSALVTLVLMISVVACGGASGTESSTGAGSSPAATASRAPANVPESIAYVRNQTEIHLVQPDGSNDHVVFKAPKVGDVQSTVGPLAWRPDSAELAFISDMEQTTSIYRYDIFGIAPDGSGLRRISNPPDTTQLDKFPKVDADVTVTNVDDGSDSVFVVYLAGAPQMQSVTIPAGTSKTVHFSNVALLQGHLQFATAIAGTARWVGAPDGPFQSGGSNHDSVQIRAGSPLEGFGTLFPVWRADGSNVADVIGKSCVAEVWPTDAPAGTTTTPLIKHAASMCVMDRGRSPDQANQILYYDAVAFAYSDGFGAVMQAQEGSATAGTPVFDPGSSGQIEDLRYLPDGSGFLFAYRPNLTDTALNIYRYDFASKDVTQLTHLTDAYVVSLSIAPDGKNVVYEVSKVDPLSQQASPAPDDLWKMPIDGQGAALFVTNGQMPDWGRGSTGKR